MVPFWEIVDPADVFIWQFPFFLVPAEGVYSQTSHLALNAHEAQQSEAEVSLLHLKAAFVQLVSFSKVMSHACVWERVAEAGNKPRLRNINMVIFTKQQGFAVGFQDIILGLPITNTCSFSRSDRS